MTSMASLSSNIVSCNFVSNVEWEPILQMSISDTVTVMELDHAYVDCHKQVFARVLFPVTGPGLYNLVFTEALDDFTMYL